MFKSVLVASTLVATVAAHQNFHQFWVNGVSPGYQVAVRMPPSNSPVTDVTSNNIACNVDGETVPSGVETYAANEGDKIIVNWDVSSHPGPITHMLFGPVDDASLESGVGAGWFKIDELDNVNGTWANQVIANAGGNYTFTLPTGLESGDYLLRSEMLALHAAETIGGAQFYIGCAQLTITGTGGGCNPTISLPGAYNATDPDIYIPDVYYGFDAATYTAPGGPVATCGASGSSPSMATSAAIVTSTAASSGTIPTAVASSGTSKVSSAAGSSSLAASAPTTLAKVTSKAASSAALATSSKAASSAASVTPTKVATTVATITTGGATPSSTGGSGAVALYGQCGGANWTGATTCAEGTCTGMNEYYSQCVSA
ncbi:Uu.00g108000.m01.CDS01 [Anthostomella pinea]|uniref:lytic cellulose monooxygenase (C4-dehydrogenating) n=1 Tax=Anthostomella pinea TaxID=933095 RepID=A0AAI8VEF8_9PEZI|nr:Uu.00g108000.m01.CDS01 [Anthostomella pinea]